MWQRLMRDEDLVLVRLMIFKLSPLYIKPVFGAVRKVFSQIEDVSMIFVCGHGQQ